MAKTIAELIDTLPQQGRVEWLGIRPGRKLPMEICNTVTIDQHEGIIGDRYGKLDGKRQVTLIQQEHITALHSLLFITPNGDPIDPAMLRRNIMVSGINLLALKNKRFHIGTALLECTGLCHPCSRMEELLGPGGYNAMRGHGGITAQVIESGDVTCGDIVSYAPSKITIENH